MQDSAAVHVIDDLDGAAAVLQPLRLRILGALRAPDSATGIGRRFGLSRQQVNYHLRRLEAAGLVELVGERRRRGCTERLMRAVARSFVISPATLGDAAVGPEPLEGDGSDTLLVTAAARVIGEAAGLGGRTDGAGRPMTTMAIQTDVSLNTPGMQRMFMNELSEAVDRVVARYHDERVVGGHRLRVMVGAYPTVDPEPEPVARRRAWSSQKRTSLP